MLSPVTLTSRLPPPSSLSPQVADILRRLRSLLVDAGSAIINRSIASSSSPRPATSPRPSVRFAVSLSTTADRYTSSSIERKQSKGVIAGGSGMLGEKDRGGDGVWGANTGEIHR